MEEDGADIVEMAVEREQTPSSLVRPYFDLVVVTTGDEPALVSVCQPSEQLPRLCSQWLCLVEVDAANRPVVFFETIDEGSHAVVP
jgi:hypothetical protein